MTDSGRVTGFGGAIRHIYPPCLPDSPGRDGFGDAPVLGMARVDVVGELERDPVVLNFADLAFRDATERYQAAVEGRRFAPLTEALYWAMVINNYHRWNSPEGECLARVRDAHPDGQVVNGVRYVRNALTHGYRVLTRLQGLKWPLFGGPGGTLDFGEFAWVGCDRVPPPDARSREEDVATQKAAYIEHLQHREPVSTLQHLGRWHDFLVDADWYPLHRLD